VHQGRLPRLGRRPIAVIELVDRDVESAKGQDSGPVQTVDADEMEAA
jgi:hypothetical protein